jgi:NAD(P)-dependent dehydrogenase (short-subunit alcohol dehydrogenase family)
MTEQDIDSSLAPQNLFSLRGKVALVTGGSGDIGRALCRGLASAGADVAINDISPAGLAAAQAEVGRLGTRVETFLADISDAADCRRLAQEVVERLGRIDVLVNCAGINKRQPILEVAPEDYDRIMAVNLRGAYFVAQAVVPHMIRQGGGKVVNISSETAAFGLSDVSVYGAAKAGLAQLTKTMAVEWAEHNIQVNCLAPGFCLTRLTDVSLWGDERKRRWLVERIPVRRPGQPEELVGTLLLFASGASSYLSGQTLYVDGGFLAGSPW